MQVNLTGCVLISIFNETQSLLLAASANFGFCRESGMMRIKGGESEQSGGYVRGKLIDGADESAALLEVWFVVFSCC